MPYPSDRPFIPSSLYVRLREARSLDDYGRVALQWCAEGQKYVLLSPRSCPGWLTVGGARSYLIGLLEARAGVWVSARARTPFLSHPRTVVARSTMLSAVTCSIWPVSSPPVAAGLVAKKSQAVRQGLKARLDDLMAVDLEITGRQGARPLVVTVPECSRHLPQGRLAIARRDKRFQQALDGLDGLPPPALPRLRVLPEGQRPGLVHVLARRVLWAGRVLVQGPRGWVQALGEAVAVGRYAQHVACRGEQPFQGLRGSLAVVQEPVDHVQEGILVAKRLFQGSCDYVGGGGVVVGEALGVEPECEVEVDTGLGVVPDGDLDPVQQVVPQEAGDALDGRERLACSGADGQRDPGVLTHDSSSVGGDGAVGGEDLASSGSGALEPTEEAHLAALADQIVNQHKLRGPRF